MYKTTKRQNECLALLSVTFIRADEGGGGATCSTKASAARLPPDTELLPLKASRGLLYTPAHPFSLLPSLPSPPRTLTSLS